MTIVSVLCLNHQSLFSSVYSSDTLGELRFSICQAAHHRRFHFYGGLAFPYSLVWIENKHNFASLELLLQTFNHPSRISIVRSSTDLEQFLTDWKLIVNENYHPEFFFHTPSKAFGLRFDNLPPLAPICTISLSSLSDRLTLSEDSFLSEPKEADDQLVDRFHQLSSLAADRFTACVRCQELSREHEEAFFSLLSDFQASPFLDQQWLALVALHFYQRNTLSSFEQYYSFVKQFLLSDYYLLRKEAFELLPTLFLIQPSFAISFVSSLLQEQDLNLKLFGLSLLKRFSTLLLSLTDGDLFFEYPFPFPLSSFNAPSLLPLFDSAYELQESLTTHFSKKPFYQDITFPKHQNALTNNTPLSPIDQVQHLNYGLQILRTLHQPFNKYQFK